MRFLSAVAASALMTATAGQAATLSYDATIASKPAAWMETLFLPMFDSALGTLNSMTISLFGSVSGSIQVERTSASFPGNRNLVFSLGSEITADVSGLPGLSVSITPIGTGAFTAAPYDGVIDYMGPSGTSISGLYDDETASTTITTGFAPFIGAGTFGIDLLALDTFSYTGGGNISQIVVNNAGATATVTYDYTPATVPLPAGLPLLLAGLGGLALVRRRKS